jgi:hypothetical protein
MVENRRIESPRAERFDRQEKLEIIFFDDGLYMQREPASHLRLLPNVPGERRDSAPLPRSVTLGRAEVRSRYFAAFLSL